MFRIVLVVLLAYANISSLGCAQIYDRVDSCLIDSRSKGVAKKAWKNHSAYWEEEENLNDFEAGFRAGYFAVMQGRGTRPPTLPPRKYWSAGNIKEDGHLRTMAWFNGYQAGTTVAKGDGVENLTRILTSDQIYRQSQSQAPVDWSESEVTPVSPIHNTPSPPSPALSPLVPTTPVPPAPPALPSEAFDMTLQKDVKPPVSLPKMNQQKLKTIDLYEQPQKIKKVTYHTFERS